MDLRSRSLAAFAMFGLLISLLPISPVRATTVVASPGDLIRGTSFSALYYMGEDGFRYVFPNEKTYGTWYTDAETGEMDFSTVKMLSDADLAMIQMGGNVTYHPGSRMVKINSDPKTYMVAHGGTLRWVSSEAIAIALYGSAWNTKIDDVADGFFTNYTIGTAITDLAVEAMGSNLSSAEFGATSSITDDKELTAYSAIAIEDMLFVDAAQGTGSLTTIHAGETVRWTNADTASHTATAEDNSWGTGTLKTGQSFVRRFNTPGTYSYYCSYHPEMTGTIVVEEALEM